MLNMSIVLDVVDPSCFLLSFCQDMSNLDLASAKSPFMIFAV